MKALNNFGELIRVVWRDKVDVSMLLFWLAAGFYFMFHQSEAIDIAKSIIELNAENTDGAIYFANTVLDLQDVLERAAAGLLFFWLYGFTSILRISWFKIKMKELKNE